MSKIAAKSAVLETALSRVALTVMCVNSPVVVFLALEKAGLAPTNPRFKLPYELAVFAFALGVALPLSISVFPETKAMKVQKIESSITE